MLFDTSFYIGVCLYLQDSHGLRQSIKVLLEYLLRLKVQVRPEINLQVRAVRPPDSSGTAFGNLWGRDFIRFITNMANSTNAILNYGQHTFFGNIFK